MKKGISYLRKRGIKNTYVFLDNNNTIKLDVLLDDYVNYTFERVGNPKINELIETLRQFERPDEGIGKLYNRGLKEAIDILITMRKHWHFRDDVEQVYILNSDQLDKLVRKVGRMIKKMDKTGGDDDTSEDTSEDQISGTGGKDRYTKKEAAELLGMSSVTLYRKYKEGKIEVRKKENGRLYFTREALLNYLQQN